MNTLASAYENHQFGRVVISAELYRAMDDAARAELFRHILPINMGCEWHSDEITMYCASPQFKPVPLGHRAPDYNLIFHQHMDPDGKPIRYSVIARE